VTSGRDLCWADVSCGILSRMFGHPCAYASARRRHGIAQVMPARRPLRYGYISAAAQLCPVAALPSACLCTAPLCLANTHLLHMPSCAFTFLPRYTTPSCLLRSAYCASPSHACGCAATLTDVRRTLHRERRADVVCKLLLQIALFRAHSCCRLFLSSLSSLLLHYSISGVTGRRRMFISRFLLLLGG